MRNLIVGLVCTVALMPATLLARVDTEQLAKDVKALQQNTARQQQDMQKLRLLLDNRGMLELLQRVDELADEVSALRGMLEQQEHELTSLKKRQRELYLDLDRRLREQEISSTPVSTKPAESQPAVADNTPAMTPAEPEQTQRKDDDVERSSQVAAQPEIPVLKPATQTGPSTSSRVTMTQERERYQKAFDMLKEGRYKMANTAFREFISQFPDSSYSGNAQYWLGESNYVSRQFEQAAKEFQSVLENYPDSNKVPDAMLKLGYTYYELRQFDQARKVLLQLQQKFATGTASQLAGKRLQRMKKEGY